MVSFFLIGGMGIAVAVAVFFGAQGLRKWQADRATTRIMKHSGPLLQREWLRLRDVKNRFRREKAVEQAAEKNLKESARKAGESKSEEKAARGTAAAAEQQADAEEVTTDMEERATAAVAAMAASSDVIQQDAEESKELAQQQERSDERVVVLTEQLEKTEGSRQIDAIAKESFLGILAEVKKNLAETLQREYMNTKRHQGVVFSLRQLLTDLLTVLKFSQFEDGKIQKMEDKERRTFRKEIDAAKKFVEEKKKQFKEETDKGDGGDQMLVVRLHRQIDVLEKNLTELVKLNTTAQLSYAYLKNETSRLRVILRKLIQIEKVEKRLTGKLRSRQKDLEKRLEPLQKAYENIAGLSEKPLGISGLIVSCSNSMNAFFTAHGELITGDLAFRAIQKEIILNHIQAEESMLQLQTLLPALEQTEKALEEAIVGVAKIAESIIGNDSADQMASLQGLEKEIKSTLEALIDLKNKALQMTKASLQQTRDKTIAAERSLEIVVKNDQHLLASLEAIHQSLRRTLAKSASLYVDRKEHVGQETQTSVQAIREALEKSNQQAAAGLKMAA